MIDPFDKPPVTPIAFRAGDTVILCEGFDECAVLRRLCDGWKQPPRIGYCQPEASPAREIKDLAIQVRMGQIASIGLVFDAEKNRANRVTEIRRWLKEAGLPVPGAALRVAKSKVAGNPICTAYLINPHGKSSGAIEKYFLPQIQSTKQWYCIRQLLLCYKHNVPARPLEEKVIVRTFIAHQNGRNTGLNAAFNAGILNCEGKPFEPVRRFLSLLRGASPVEKASASDV